MDTGHASVSQRPDLYDWHYIDQVEDIPMYCALAEGHSEVLECGIGSGRIAIPMAEAGKIVYGIDSSPEMLGRLEAKLKDFPESVRKKVRFYQADMRDFDLGRKFSHILVPFSTFNYLLTLKDQKKSLLSIRRHLAPQGTLVLELLSFSLFPKWLDNDNLLRKVITRRDPGTGKAVELWRVVRFDSASQIVEQDRHYRFYDESGVLEKEMVVLWRNRFFLMGEMQLLLDATGFEVTNIYGDCDFGPYEHHSEFAVVIAKPKQHTD